MSGSRVSSDGVAVVTLNSDGASRSRPRDERVVLRAAKRGAPDALEELARLYWPDAYRIALVVVADRAAAEDVAQEALIAAISQLDRFDGRRAFRPWLYRIVTNRALDWTRARSRRMEVELAGQDVAESEPVRSAAISDDLMAALLELDPRDRAVVVLRHLLGLKSHEIGRIVGTSAGTVRSILKRALARLRQELGEEEHVD